MLHNGSFFESQNAILLTMTSLSVWYVNWAVNVSYQEKYEYSSAGIMIVPVVNYHVIHTFFPEIQKVNRSLIQTCFFF